MTFDTQTTTKGYYHTT